MRITVILLLISILFSLNTLAQDYTQWHLPEGAVARLGKGTISDIAYSPDGTRLAVAGSVGIWYYDAETYKEVSLIVGDATARMTGIAFSPDGRRLVGGGTDKTVRLWDAKSGTLQRTIQRAHGFGPLRRDQSGWEDARQRRLQRRRER